MDPRIERLRGEIVAQEPGARGIEHVARNPECLRLRAVTIAGLPPSEAAKILDAPNDEGQSPFALAMGNRFEHQLLQNGAAELFALYRKEGLLALHESKIVAVSEFAPESKPRDLLRREAETKRLLLLKLRGSADAPNLIIKPRLRVILVGMPHPIEPDYFVASDSEGFYRVGELKSYADRGGKTDQADIRSACRQAAVGTVALRQLLQTLLPFASSDLVESRADLVLKVTGLMIPSLYSMKIEGEVDSIERALAESPTSLDELEALLPTGATLSDPATLSAIPNNYRSSCKEHCAMWRYCRAQAISNEQPAVLGDYAAEKLAPAGNISRAIQLMTGTGEPPRDAAEASLARDLQAANQVLQKAAAND
ncbi:MAG TPA: hypothetical protein VGH91_12615 [Gammaproteobacteria bacterium]